MPKMIRCKVLLIAEDGSEREIAGASRPFAHDLSERENGRRILELAAEQLPTEKTKPRPD